VKGGTGWAVGMAIDIRHIPVFVFDQYAERWYKYDYGTQSWVELNEIPTLT
jgi:hypothetical protein